MHTCRRAAALLGVVAVAWTVGSGSLLAAQTGAAARPALTDAQIEDDAETLTRDMGSSLSSFEIEALLARRDEIVTPRLRCL